MNLLDEKKIGEFLALGFELDKENQEIGLILASADVSAACGFKYEEWEAFVQGVNEANRRFLEKKEEL